MCRPNQIVLIMPIFSLQHDSFLETLFFLFLDYFRVDRKSLLIIYHELQKAARPSIPPLPRHPEKVKKRSIAIDVTTIVVVCPLMKKKVLVLWFFPICPMSKPTTTIIILLDRCLIFARYVWRNTTKEKRSLGRRTRNANTPSTENAC